jgi:predicted aspartyl protease
MIMKSNIPIPITAMISLSLRRPLHFLACSLLLSGAVQAQEPATCRYSLIATFPIRFAGPQLAPAIEGSINGSPALLLVSTGAATFLTLDSAQRRNLPLHAGRGGGVRGASDYTQIWTTRLDEFAVGPIRVTRIRELPVFGNARDAMSYSYDGHLGAQMLHDKRMRMFDSDHCGGAKIRPWAEATHVLPYNDGKNSWNPHFTVLVNDKEVDAVIESSIERSYMKLEAAQRLGINETASGARIKRGSESILSSDNRTARWSVPVDSLQIGGERIRDIDLDVADPKFAGEADLVVGRDFLRTHRVLFANKQRKLYVAYAGGELFPRTVGPQPWVMLEAENGNADAQYLLSRTTGVQEAKAWLDKAAAQGHPQASLVLGRERMDSQPAAAIPLLRTALEKMPSNRPAALWLYNALIRNGEAEQARTELQASLSKQDDEWPRPIGEFYLGKLDAAGLLAAAGKEQAFAQERTCQATNYMMEWQTARGDKAQAASLLATLRAHCAGR